MDWNPRKIILLSVGLCLLIGLGIPIGNFVYNFRYRSNYPDAGPIHEAAEARNVAALEQILAQNPKLLEAPGGTRDQRGDLIFRGTPLQYAALYGPLDAVKVLVERGAYVDRLAPLSAETPLLLSVSSLDEIDIPLYLLRHGADVNGSGIAYTPLHKAAECNARRTAEILLKHGADVNAKNDLGMTPLSMAASFGSADLIKLLLARGSKINSRDDYCCTPLHYAVEMGNVPVMSVLLKAGADVNAQDQRGRTALHIAATFFRDDLKELITPLKSYRADPSIRDAEGHTALDLAIKASNLKAVEALQGKR